MFHSKCLLPMKSDSFFADLIVSFEEFFVFWYTVIKILFRIFLTFSFSFIEDEKFDILSF